MDNRDLFFQDVKVGDGIPSVIKKITLVQNVMYAGATWDFHRHHYDKEFVQSKVLPGTFVDGQMFGAFLAQMVTHWAGPSGVLKKLRLTYRVMAFPGDVVTCKGKIAEKYTKDGENLISCELWIENQKGEKVIAPAHALIALPSRSVSQS
ncbi:hypothetical protein KA005_20420 [bacterium]|nr:hypothetical protein [bacterium]